MRPRDFLVVACAFLPLSAVEGATIEVLATPDELSVAPGDAVSLTIQAANLEQMPAPDLLSMRMVFLIDAIGSTAADEVSIVAAASVENSLFPEEEPLFSDGPGGFMVSIAALPPSLPAILPGGGVVDLFSLELSVGQMASGEYQLVLLPFAPMDPNTPGFLELGLPPLIAPFANPPTAPHEPNSLLATLRVVPEPMGASLLACSFFSVLSLRRQSLHHVA